MLEMSTMYLPVNQNWNKYLENCQNAFDDSQYVLKKLLETSANEACKFKGEQSSDPWLFDLDWSAKELKLNKNISKSSPTDSVIIKSVIGVDEISKENPFYEISSEKTKHLARLSFFFYIYLKLNLNNILISKIDNFDKTLELSDATKNALLTCKSLPKNIQYLYDYPKFI